MAARRSPPHRDIASSSRARQMSPSGVRSRSRSRSRTRSPSQSRSPTPSHRQPAPIPSNHDTLQHADSQASAQAASEIAIPPSDAPHEQALPLEQASPPPGTTNADDPLETPLRRPRTAQDPKSARKLDVMKLALLNDLPFSHIPEVTLQYMRDFVLARFPSDAPPDFVTLVKDEMVRIKDIVEASGRWRACPEDPEKMDGHEDVVFDFLEKLFQHMQKAVAKVYRRAPIFKFMKAPAESPERNPTSPAVRPDGAMILCGEDDYTWFNLGTLFEFKRNDTLQNVDDDIEKIIYAMHRILSADARRRFSIGVIIENRKARILFMDRQKLITSERFDIIDDKEMLIHLYLSFAFASLEDAGFDRSVELKEVRPDGSPLYRITTCDGKVYDDAVVMCDYTINMIIGRATRIFKARGEDGEERIVKDIWLEEDRIPEHTIMHEMKQDIIRAYNEKTAKDVMEHFLTPHETSCGTIKVLVDGEEKEDHTINVMSRGEPLENGRTMLTGFALRNAPERPYETTQGTYRDHAGAVYTYPDRRLPHATTAKVHYRAVYMNVATPFYEVGSMYRMWCLLMHVIMALAIIHSVGWVHRDISGGNLYWLAGNGILGDVEYAKKIGTATVVDNGRRETTHDVKTGTYDFMSVEVSTTSYVFRKPDEQKIAETQTSRKPTGNTNILGLFAPLPEDQPETDVEAAPEYHERQLPKFRYNPLHDVESIFWIVVYMFFLKTDSSDEKERRRQLPNRSKWINRLFPADGTIGARKEALQTEGFFDEAVKCLPEKFRTKWQPAAKLSKLRDLLVKAYLSAEADPFTINPGAWKMNDIHRPFHDLFKEASAIKDSKMYLFPTLREIRAAEEQEEREKREKRAGEAQGEAEGEEKAAGKKGTGPARKAKGKKRTQPTRKAKGKKRKRDEDDESEDERPSTKKSGSRSQAGPSGTRGGTARSIAVTAAESVDPPRRSARLRKVCN